MKKITLRQSGIKGLMTCGAVLAVLAISLIRTGEFVFVKLIGTFMVLGIASTLLFIIGDIYDM